MKPGPKRAISDDAVLDAAFEQLVRGGVAGVSIRGVAGILDIAPSAVYTYFATKTALLGAMVERVFGELDLVSLCDQETPARSRLHTVALQLREILVTGPGAVTLIMSGPVGGPRSMAFNEALLELFSTEGLAIDDAARAAYAVQVYVLGFIALEASELPENEPVLSDDARTEKRRRELESLPIDPSSLTAKTADIVAQYNSGAQFAWGLDRMLDGLLTR